MSKVTNIKSKSVRKLLREVFANKEFSNELPMVTLERNQMWGAIYVDQADRYSALSTIFDSYNVRDHSDGDGQVVFMSPRKFELNCDDQSFNYKLGYSFKSNFNVQYNVVEESLHSVLSIKNGNQTLGFFKFHIELAQREEQIILEFHMDYIYICKNHRNRNRNNWQNLTTALASLFTITLQSLVQIIHEDNVLTVVLYASNINSGGEKISKLMLRELNWTLEFLADEMPEKRKCLHEVIPEID